MKKSNEKFAKRLLAAMSPEAISRDLPPEEQLELLRIQNACLQVCLNDAMDIPELGEELVANLKKKKTAGWSS